MACSNWCQDHTIMCTHIGNSTPDTNTKLKVRAPFCLAILIIRLLHLIAHRGSMDLTSQAGVGIGEYSGKAILPASGRARDGAVEEQQSTNSPSPVAISLFVYKISLRKENWNKLTYHLFSYSYFCQTFLHKELLFDIFYKRFMPNWA